MKKNKNSENEKLKEPLMMRMVSMLQPLGPRRRIEKVIYLFMNSDYIQQQEIKDQKSFQIDTSSQSYKDMLKIRQEKQKIVKEDVEKIKKVFQEKDNKQKYKGEFVESLYCLDSNNKTKPQEVIYDFFRRLSAGKEPGGYVIYFSGQITQGIACLPFQIGKEVHLITVQQILKMWTDYLNGYKYQKQLLLIIESPQSAQFLDGIYQCKDRVHHYNVSFLISEKEKRTTYAQIVSYLKQYEQYQKVVKQRMNYEDITPSNFEFKQDKVWKIQDYANCSGFTAALCEHLLDSPPKRIEELYQSKKEFYFNKYLIQPAFYGFAMKHYLDFGWYLDINYYKIQQQSSINYFGIKRSHFNLEMDEISQEQQSIIFKQFNYFGLVKNKKTDILIQDPKLIEKQKKIKQQNEQQEMQKKVGPVIQTQEEYSLDLQIIDDLNLIRHCNGVQIYENEENSNNKGVYLGQWFNNKQNGLGVAIYSNGDRYEGEFQDGKQNGLGYLYNLGRGTIYSGQFYNNMFFGTGQIIWYEQKGLSCFVGNFNDKDATGFSYDFKGDKEKKVFGIISDKKTFTPDYKDHELNMDVPEEEQMFSINKDPSIYDTDYKENRIDTKCNFKKEFEEYQKKQDEFKKKAEENLKMLIFKNILPSQELPNLSESNEGQENTSQQNQIIQDITLLPQYNEFKEEMNDLNPDLKEDQIKDDDVEFLLKHAVCNEELNEEEIKEKEEKTKEILEQIDFDLLDDEIIFQQPQTQNQQIEIQQNIVQVRKEEEGEGQQLEIQKQEEESKNQKESQQNENEGKKAISEQQKQPQQQVKQNGLLLIPLVAMKEYYKNQGIDLFVTNESIKQDIKQQFKQTMLNIGQTQNNQYRKVNIQDDDKVNFNQTILNGEEKEKFIKKFKKNAAKAHGCKPEDIVIFGLSKGSINIEYKLKNDLSVFLKSDEQAMEFFKNKCNYKDAKLKMHNLLEKATLTPENCDPLFNYDWSKEPKGKISYRGWINYKNIGKKRQHYIFPAGWKGFGLNISKYLDKEWIGYVNGKPTYNSELQWVVLYHGTTIQGLEGITKTEFKVGSYHKYGGKKCRITGKLIDKSSSCVYLSDDADEAANYSVPFVVNEKPYKMVFQCRVNPQVLRSPKDKPSYYIVEESGKPGTNIRPYRILLKKLNEQEYKDFLERENKSKQNNYNPDEVQYDLKNQYRELAEEIDNIENINHPNADSGSKSNEDSDSQIQNKESGDDKNKKNSVPKIQLNKF